MHRNNPNPRTDNNPQPERQKHSIRNIALGSLGIFMVMVILGSIFVPGSALAVQGNDEMGANYADEDNDGGCDNFVDENGDGINDDASGYARDDDGDGIPNGQDDDYAPARDGTGRQQGENGQNSSCARKGDGSGDGEGQKKGGCGGNSSHGNGDSGKGSGARDGSCGGNSSHGKWQLRRQQQSRQRRLRQGQRRP